MKVQIEIEDKYVNAVADLLALTDDKSEQAIEQVKQKCLSEIIEISADDFGEDAQQFKLGLAMMAIGTIGEEIAKQ